MSSRRSHATYIYAWYVQHSTYIFVRSRLPSWPRRLAQRINRSHVAHTASTIYIYVCYVYAERWNVENALLPWHVVWRVF